MSAFRFRAIAIGCCLLGLAWTVARADVIDDAGSLGGVFDESLLDVHGDRWSPEMAGQLNAARKRFAKDLNTPEAKQLWNSPEGEPGASALATARALGDFQARLQHVAALEMIGSQAAGHVEAAQEWRSIIRMPKYANAVEGELALQHLGEDPNQRAQVSQLLAREYVVWQITRAREKMDSLVQLITEGRATPSLIAARAEEIQGLAALPDSLLKLAIGTGAPAQAEDTAFRAVLDAPTTDQVALAELVSTWRVALEASYPNLLSDSDVQQRERIVLKLLRLVPREYRSGVRDGQVAVPLEYREAKSFTLQARQIINELMPVWRKTKTSAVQNHGPELLTELENLQIAINGKVELAQVEACVQKTSATLEGNFDLTLKRAGMASDVVAETTLEIRSLLGQSLAAAQSGDWRLAKQIRNEAYVNFDLEIESRALPRDPTLARKAEAAFLEGSPGKPGIKAVLDSQASAAVLEASYQNTLDLLGECTALLKVGLSPTAAMLSTLLIISREGLEAVVILAALLAGLRGTENAGTRRRIGLGAWLALAASAVLFVASRTLLQGLSHYGETLEAVISILAVIILLMVTNWVFHKYYWTGWNSRLRDMSKAAQRQTATRWENLALIGVGFMTIFREGFETTLFMQSLILEAGMKSVALGLALGFLLIGTIGFAVFSLGAKLPYRKMLVVTGFLVIFVLFTFLGSTVRLFQTVGWLTVHPVPGLELPSWTGVWLGIYPTWEGVLIPFAAFAYVGTMWLWVKITAKRAEREMKEQTPENVPDRPVPPQLVA